MKKLLFLLMSIVSCGAFAQTCTTTIDPGTNVATALSSAASGATICLNSGNWGSVTLDNIVKSNYVTIRSTTGVGATILPTISGGTRFVRLSSLTLNGFDISGSTTRDIGILNSTVTATSSITTTSMNNNNILIDGNTFNNINANGGLEGRLNVRWPNGPGSVPSGVVVSNNTFGGGGCSDGIQDGAYGTVIGPGNIFTNITQGNCSEHVDSIQGYGQSHSVIKGNYFSNVTVCLGYYDGGNTETIENNVLANSCVVDLGTLNSTTFRHNTLRNISARVGGINQSGGGSGTYSENIMQGSAFNGGISSSCTACTFTHNMFSSGGNGTNNIIATPTYTGGTTPSAWAGWQLTSASAGYKAALDGTDMGALYFGQGGGSPVTIAPPTALQVLP